MNKITLSLVLVFALAACSDDDAGPIDGTWSLSATTCDGQAGQFPPYTIDIADDVGTFTFNFAADCVAVFDETYEYTDGAIVITPQSVSCAPDSGCMAAIGASCPMLPPPVTYDYALNGDTLEFSAVSAGPPADPCPAGEQIKFTMTGD